MKNFYFKLHDHGGRIISIIFVDAKTYGEACEVADAQAKERLAHAVTYCDKNGKTLDVPYPYWTNKLLAEYFEHCINKKKSVYAKFARQ